MPFCVNCGNKLPDNAKFCNNCGQNINKNHERKSIFEGLLYKCPKCGEELKSFTGICPACGYEVRGSDATSSVVTFYEDLRNTSTPEQKDCLIRNFPIPNTKEDITEFMILASSNLYGEDNKDIFEAWISKFDQCYKKSVLLFGKDADFGRIQQIYSNCQEIIKTEKERDFKKNIINIMLKNISFFIGIAVLIFAIGINISSGDSNVFELISYIILIASSIGLAKRGAKISDYAVAIGSGLLVIISSFIFDDGSAAELCGSIILIIAAVNYFKGNKKDKK